MSKQLDPAFSYTVKGKTAVLVSGAFYDAMTGAFISWAKDTRLDDICVLISSCPDCGEGRSWFSFTGLDDCDGIKCENCPVILLPVAHCQDSYIDMVTK